MSSGKQIACSLPTKRASVYRSSIHACDLRSESPHLKKKKRKKESWSMSTTCSASIRLPSTSTSSGQRRHEAGRTPALLQPRIVQPNQQNRNGLNKARIWQVPRPDEGAGMCVKLRLQVTRSVDTSVHSDPALITHFLTALSQLAFVFNTKKKNQEYCYC